MEALWHSIINVGIVIASIVVAVLVAQEKRLGLKSVLLFLVGVFLYGLVIYFEVTQRDCDVVTSNAFWKFIDTADTCIESNIYEIAVAQTAIIASLLIWLAMAWNSVFRRLANEESE